MIVAKAWAQTAEEQGNYEQAAKCHIALGQYATAVANLGRRGGVRGTVGALDVGTILVRD